MKHTPGPWYNHGLDGIFDNRTHGPSIQSGNGKVICAVEAIDADLPDFINEERQANASLIAAAPEMFALIKQVVNETDNETWLTIGNKIIDSIESN